MTQDDIIRMARKAGFADGVAEIVGLDGFERFAALVLANNPPKSSMAWQEGYSQGRLDESLEAKREAREAVEFEREQCAKACEDYTDKSDADHESHGYSCAAAIRARGQA